MEISFRVKYQGAVPSQHGMTQREFNDLVREAWYHVGKYWMTHFRAKHFTKAGAREYRYAPRVGEGESGKRFWRSYTGRKQKTLGHTDPLVYSGDSRRSTQTARVTATATTNKSQCRVTMNAPNLNYPGKKRRDGRPGIDLRDEMTRISPAEWAELVKQHDKKMDELLGSFGKETEIFYAKAA